MHKIIVSLNSRILLNSIIAGAIVTHILLYEINTHKQVLKIFASDEKKKPSELKFYEL